MTLIKDKAGNWQEVGGKSGGSSEKAVIETNELPAEPENQVYKISSPNYIKNERVYSSSFKALRGYVNAEINIPVFIQFNGEYLKVYQNYAPSKLGVITMSILQQPNSDNPGGFFGCYFPTEKGIIALIDDLKDGYVNELLGRSTEFINRIDYPYAAKWTDKEGKSYESLGDYCRGVGIPYTVYGYISSSDLLPSTVLQDKTTEMHFYKIDTISTQVYAKDTQLATKEDLEKFVPAPAPETEALPAVIETDELPAEPENQVYVETKDKIKIVEPAGKTWTQSNITSGNFYTIIYANGVFVAGSYSSKGIYYSEDGKNWTQSNVTSGNFYTIIYANGVFVAGSYDSNGIYYSEDGKTWTQSNVTSGDFYTIIYANGIFGAVRLSNGIYYSEDGKTWAQSNVTSGEFYVIAHVNGIFVAGGFSSNGIYYSEDGKTWTQSNVTSGDICTITYANGIFVAGGYNSNGIYYSEDGKNWIQSNVIDGNIRAITYANGIFVAGTTSGNGIYYSEDGKNWIQSNVIDGNIRAIIHANGIFVAGSSSSNGTYYSEDGKTWTQSNVTSSSIHTITYVNGVFVAGSFSSNGIYYSEDGKTWTQSNVTSGDIRTITHANGIFVAGGFSSNGIYYSKDISEVIGTEKRVYAKSTQLATMEDLEKSDVVAPVITVERRYSTWDQNNLSTSLQYGGGNGVNTGYTQKLYIDTGTDGKWYQRNEEYCVQITNASFYVPFDGPGNIEVIYYTQGKKSYTVTEDNLVQFRLKNYFKITCDTSDYIKSIKYTYDKEVRAIETKGEDTEILNLSVEKGIEVQGVNILDEINKIWAKINA